MKKKLSKVSKAISLKSPWEIEKMRYANKVVAETLLELVDNLVPGMTTSDLDKIALSSIVQKKGKPAFKGYKGYPANICVSLNNEVVHGIPSIKRVLQQGDLVSIDLGVIYDGYYGDAAISHVIGEPTEQQARLLAITEKSLYNAIDLIKPGVHLGDISATIQKTVETEGYSVVRKFVGHGIGRSLHEPPEVPNYGNFGDGPILRRGLVIAIEPMVNEGTSDVEVLKDGWTVVTADGSMSAHFEHSVAVTDMGYEILSSI